MLKSKPARLIYIAFLMIVFILVQVIIGMTNIENPYLMTLKFLSALLLGGCLGPLLYPEQWQSYVRNQFNRDNILKTGLVYLLGCLLISISSVFDHWLSLIGMVIGLAIIYFGSLTSKNNEGTL